MDSLDSKLLPAAGKREGYVGVGLTIKEPPIDPAVDGGGGINTKFPIPGKANKKK